MAKYCLFFKEREGGRKREKGEGDGAGKERERRETETRERRSFRTFQFIHFLNG